MPKERKKQDVMIIHDNCQESARSITRLGTRTEYGVATVSRTD